MKESWGEGRTTVADDFWWDELRALSAKLIWLSLLYFSPGLIPEGSGQRGVQGVWGPLEFCLPRVGRRYRVQAGAVRAQDSAAEIISISLSSFRMNQVFSPCFSILESLPLAAYGNDVGVRDSACHFLNCSLLY